MVMFKILQGMGWPLRLIGDALELRHLRREMRYFHRRLVPTKDNKDGVRPETNQEYLERLRQAEIETR